MKDTMHFLITGHTGFKGSWLTHILRQRGHRVSGISLPPETGSLFQRTNGTKFLENDIRCDIRESLMLSSHFKSINPDVVIHLAAQALVRESYKDPLKTFQTNVMGTINVLKASQYNTNIKAQLIVTTDKVYKNVSKSSGYYESDELGGQDPYSASKAMADIATQSWISSFNNPRTAIARAGNVIGGGDVCADRLIPDLINSYSAGLIPKLRAPNYIRPWQHVLDCLNGYLLVAQSHLSGALETPKSVNFGPSKSLSVSQLITILETVFKQRFQIEVAPSSFQEAIWLQLDSQLAHQFFGWQPTLSIEQSIMQAGNWYSKFLANCDAAELMLSEIDQFKVGKF